MLDFTSDNIILVTGASSGIGREIALTLVRQGASVIANGRSLERLQETKQKSVKPQNMFIEPFDLLENIENIPNRIKELKEKYGKLRGLVCAAGVDEVQTIQMINIKSFENIFKINYLVPLFCAKGFADKRNNIGEGASIVFIASIAGVFPDTGQIVYGGSKAALIAASRSISKELSKRKIRCNCISPAWVDTPMFKRHDENIGANTDNYALGIGKPSDIANLTTYLLSDEARWITGQNYILDGGN